MPENRAESHLSAARCVSWLSAGIGTFHIHHANISESSLRIPLLWRLRGTACNAETG